MQKQNSRTIIIIFLCFFFFLAFLFPHTGDDWDWSTQLGLDRLSTFFQGYNGRYLGNLLVICLTRSKLFTALFMAVSFTFSLWACHRYSESRSTHTLFLAAILFFSMPKSLFSEAIVWTSGFINYVPSVLISVLYILLYQTVITQNTLPSLGIKGTILTFFLGIAGGLFIENITLFNICLAIAVMGYTWIKQKKWSIPQISFLFGSVIGAAIMFSNSAYRAIANDVDEYRNVPLTAYETIIYVVKHANAAVDYLIYENILSCGILSSLVLFLILRYQKAATHKVKKSTYAFLSSHIICLLIIVFIHFFPDALYNIPCNLGLFPFLMDFTIFLIAFFYLLTICGVILLCVPKEQCFHILMPLCCAVISTIPMLIVEPFGPRCVFSGYIFMMIFTVTLFGHLQQEACLTEKFEKNLKSGMCSILVLQMLFFSIIFSSVCFWNVRRNSYITQQSYAGNQTIYLCPLPWEGYLHNSSPTEYYLIDMFKLYHRLDPDVTLEVISREALNQLILQNK